MKKIIVGLIVVIIIAIIAIGGYFMFVSKSPSPVASSFIYKDSDFGFEMTFPNSWKGLAVTGEVWTGHIINNYQQTYTGPLDVFRNPQTTATQQYQNIPIMVFTPEVWAMVSGNNPTVAVSAAPIGPAKIGENAKYVFATPPRWYGFTDAIGFEEAVNIVKTFKAF